MARRFRKVSEEEIVAINEAAFFYPSDLVNTKTTIPHRVGEEYIPRCFASQYIFTTIHLPFGGYLYNIYILYIYRYIYLTNKEA